MTRWLLLLLFFCFVFLFVCVFFLTSRVWPVIKGQEFAIDHLEVW